MGEPMSKTGKVTQNNGGSGVSRGTTVAIDADALGRLMNMAGVSADSLAAATGKSGSYVRQLRLGMRTRASRDFVERAGDYLARMLGEPARVGMALILDETNKDKSGR